MAWPTIAAYANPGHDTWDGADPTALYLKKFSGEIIASMDRALKVRPLVTTRTIDSGKSAQFPVLGRATAGYHTRGTNILNEANGLLSMVEHAEKIIYVDKRLISAVLVDDVDEMLNHYDLRGPYAKQLGTAIGRQVDEQLINLAIIGARSPTILDDDNAYGGSNTKNGTFIYTGNGGGNTPIDTADEIIAALTVMQWKMDEKEVDEEDRWCVMTPKYFRLLVDVTASTNSGVHLSHDYNLPNGSVAKGTVLQVAGFTILKTTGLVLAAAGTSGNAISSTGNVYDVQTKDASLASGTVCVCFHTSGLGDLLLRGIGMEMKWYTEYQATLILAKLLGGRNFLRAEACGEIWGPVALPTANPTGDIVEMDDLGY